MNAIINTVPAQVHRISQKSGICRQQHHHVCKQTELSSLTTVPSGGRQHNLITTPNCRFGSITSAAHATAAAVHPVWNPALLHSRITHPSELPPGPHSPAAEQHQQPRNQVLSTNNNRPGIRALIMHPNLSTSSASNDAEQTATLTITEPSH